MPKKIINTYKPYIFFWRIIKASIICGLEWKIDEKIIKIIKQSYKYWIESDYFLNEPNNDEYDQKDDDDIDEIDTYSYKDFLRTLFNDNIVVSWLDYKILLTTFDTLDFNKRFIKSLKKSKKFKKKFIHKLNNEDDDVIDLFEENKYPTD